MDIQLNKKNSKQELRGHRDDKLGTILQLTEGQIFLRSSKSNLRIPKHHFTLQLLFPRKFMLSQISPPISKHPVYRSLSVVQSGKRDEPADSRRRTNERTIRTEGNNERTQRTVQV